MKLSLIIASAGKGSRMKMERRKQNIPIHNKPLLWHTLYSILNTDIIFSNIYVMVNEKDLNYTKNHIIPDLYIDKRITVNVLPGGSSRVETISKGINNLDESTDFVLIHDGARPFVSKDLLNRLLDELRDYNAVIPAVSVKDTIKVKNNNSLVVDTLDRDSLVAVQTPQAFSYKIIRKAYKMAENIEGKIYDDSLLVEKIKEPVKIVKGDYDNFKITTKEDLVKAKMLLKKGRNK
ncbi:MAG: 2-C-methyl-D-erythritol 4-phosphate cytidylyltransferase [Halarsenatibacteraceae bacterium]